MITSKRRKTRYYIIVTTFYCFMVTLLMTIKLINRAGGSTKMMVRPWALMVHSKAWYNCNLMIYSTQASVI